MDAVFQKAEYCLIFVSKNLDLIAFQNIIIGVMVLLIFIGGLIFQDLKTEKDKSKFSQMVLLSEVFNLKYVTVVTLGSLLLISFADLVIDQYRAIYLMLFIGAVLGYLFLQIVKINNWLDGSYHSFEIKYLKGFDKATTFKKSEDQIRAWCSFWSETVNYKEQDFVDLYVGQIDNNFKHNISKAKELSKCYLLSIDNKDTFILGNKILPKALDWIEKSRNSNDGYFFQNELFVKIEEKLLFNLGGNSVSGHQFFSVFKAHIEKNKEHLKSIKGKDEKESYSKYLSMLFSTFMRTFLYKNLFKQENIFHNDFPKSWKVIQDNYDEEKWEPRAVLGELTTWIGTNNPRIFRSNNIDFDPHISRLISGLFPTVDSILFKEFLMLYFASRMSYNTEEGCISSLVKTTLEEDANFIVSNPISAWSSVDDDNFDERMDQLFEQQRDETIEVIDKFFMNTWPPVFENEINDDKTISRVKKFIDIRLSKLNEIAKELNDSPKSDKQKRLLTLLNKMIEKYNERIKN